MPRRITNVSARFNVEARPFQHIRVEVAAVITKDDDADEVRNELTSYAKTVCDGLLKRIYNIPHDEPAQPPDNVPY